MFAIFEYNEKLNNDDHYTSSLNVPASLLDTVISNVIATATAEDESSDDIPKVISSTLHVLKNMLTRTTVILVITIWHLGERMKSKGI